jgi:hypothetical protein
MYAKLNNGTIDKYPYTTSDLKSDNPQTSFPDAIPEEMLSSFGMVPVIPTEAPAGDYRAIIREGKPNLVNGLWKQTWTVELRTSDKVKEIADRLRQEAYQKESDPLFFKWQRGEASEQEWTAKVDEIKQRFPN